MIYDVIVIGHGIAGAVLAWELKQRNLNFLVLENPLLEKSSAVAGGLFNPLMFNKLRLARMTETLWPVMYDTYSAIEHNWNIKLLHQIDSAKLLTNSEIKEWESGQSSAIGKYISSIIPSPGIKGIKSVDAAGIIKDSGYLDIPLLLSESKARLQAAGRFIEKAVEYEEIIPVNELITISNQFRTRKIVFCEGAHIKSNPWFNFAAVSPNKGELIEIKSSGLARDYVVRNKVFILPFENHAFKVGATYSHNYSDSLPSSEGLSELTTKLDEMLDVPYRIVSHKAGVRPAIRDRMPILGPNPEYKSLLVMNGFGSKGVAYAPFCAKTMIEWLLTGKIQIPNHLNVNRFWNQNR
ncbi:NAD(P)/FAD-dependent oxidoreductase [Alkaliflexus imshenetskii]|uniref:NAD(P)/FAD-dependent oxidoreductase n=1 Tax=Alkaliflexus imshenetskii TaxID=286730 RepID=UPI000478CAF1|nr:FAD-binding oxidoreductase [Alkaliflexus imshenetskii]